MRNISMPWFFGLCLSVVACTGTVGEEAGPEMTDPAAAAAQAEQGADEAPVAPAPLATNEAPIGEDASAPSPAPSDADAGDAGTEAGKMQIPMPSFGKIYASTNTGDACAWTLDGVAKGTSSVLDIALATGTYDLSCKRTLDGLVKSQSLIVAKSQTTNVVFSFPVVNGEIVAVAIGGTCAFSVNGAAKGTASQLKLSIPPGTYSVTCKPTTGASTISRSVIVKSGETAMAMFNLGA